MKRGGRRDVTTRVGGVTAQKLRFLEILLIAPWRFQVSKENGFPVARPLTIQIANPTSYLVQKILALPRRDPADVPKDLLYLHDTFLVFVDKLDAISAGWMALRSVMHPNHVRTFERLAREHLEKVTDPLRSAARIAAGRPQPPSPDMLLAGLRRGRG